MTFAELVKDLTDGGMRLKDANALALSVERARNEQTASQSFRLMMMMMEFETAWDGSGLERPS